jgi:hypothetical protein
MYLATTVICTMRGIDGHDFLWTTRRLNAAVTS